MSSGYESSNGREKKDDASTKRKQKLKPPLPAGARPQKERADGNKKADTASPPVSRQRKPRSPPRKPNHRSADAKGPKKGVERRSSASPRNRRQQRQIEEPEPQMSSPRRYKKASLPEQPQVDPPMSPTPPPRRGNPNSFSNNREWRGGPGSGAVGQTRKKPQGDPEKPKMLMGTVKGPNQEDFDPEHAAEQLRKAFKGLGTDERVVIEVFGEHTNWQRQEIKQKYKQMYGRDLLNDLEDELGGHFLELCLALLCPSHLYDAHLLRRAMDISEGLGTDEECLVELLCTRTNSELELIKEAYFREFHRNLDKDIRKETSGDYKKFLTSIVNASRDENKEIDMAMATKDANALITGGVGQLGTNEEVFNRVFCTRSWGQIKATINVYRKNTGRDIEVDLRKEFSGDMQTSLLAIVKVCKNMQAFFAERLHESVKGAGTDDDALIRLIVSRSEIDLEQIKEEYQRRFKQSLWKAIKDDCSGDYCRLLIKLIGTD